MSSTFGQVSSDHYAANRHAKSSRGRIVDLVDQAIDADNVKRDQVLARRRAVGSSPDGQDFRAHNTIFNAKDARSLT